MKSREQGGSKNSGNALAHNYNHSYGSVYATSEASKILQYGGK